MGRRTTKSEQPGKISIIRKDGEIIKGATSIPLNFVREIMKGSTIEITITINESVLDEKTKSIPVTWKMNE